MSTSTITPNMSLILPTVGQEPGPQYGTDQNNSFTILDSHNHSAGSGVQITPSGINISSDLTFMGNSATDMFTVDFESQASALTGNNFLSFVGGNLYVNDGVGNQIAITSGGGVAGSPGSIGGLVPPAAATYSAGSKTFIWTADSLKSAAMDNGAVTIRETNVASAKGVTLASRTSLAADYQLTLPTGLPASTQYLTSTSAGLLSYSTADMIASAITPAGADVIAASMTSTGADDIGLDMTLVGADSIGQNMTNVGSAALILAMTSTAAADHVGSLMTSTGANAIAASMTTTGTGSIVSTMTSGNANTIIGKYTRASGASTEGLRGVAQSAVITEAITTSTTPANSSLSVILTTSGRPVHVILQADNTTSGSISGTATDFVRLVVFPDPTAHAISQVSVSVAIKGYSAIDFYTPTLGAGTYTYKLQAISAATGSVTITNMTLVAYEL